MYLSMILSSMGYGDFAIELIQTELANLNYVYLLAFVLFNSYAALQLEAWKTPCK